MRIFFYRAYQTIMKLVVSLVKWPDPELLEGEDCVLKVPEILTQRKITSVLLVTDCNIISLGLARGLMEGLEKAAIRVYVFDEVVPNPTIDNIEDALKVYHSNHCQALIAFGGGSPMDCAKGVGARVARPRRTIPQMRGLLKVLKPIPFLVTIPTTAGTGSEITLACVVTNSRTHEKYSVTDPFLVPRVAVLDPLLTINLPPHITACTGIDALTHAVEAYIGRSNTAATRKAARDAIKLIFNNLPTAYSNGKDIPARINMLRGSFYGGWAFTRAYVGYVHALAHTLGGYYSVPHGLANAVLLPYVLEYYGEPAHKALAELADLIGAAAPGDSTAVKAGKFIARVRELETAVGIPDKIEGIKDSHLPGMIQNALLEANPLYPVPRILFKEDLRKLYNMIRI